MSFQSTQERSFPHERVLKVKDLYKQVGVFDNKFCMNILHNFLEGIIPPLCCSQRNYCTSSNVYNEFDVVLSFQTLKIVDIVDICFINIFKKFFITRQFLPIQKLLISLLYMTSSSHYFGIPPRFKKFYVSLFLCLFFLEVLAPFIKGYGRGEGTPPISQKNV